jgi:glycosyltransferase involved in cell wall biosynthesis
VSDADVRRVLHICEPTDSGAALVSFRLAQGLRARGVEPLILTPPGRLTGWCTEAGIPVIELPLSRRSPTSYVQSIRRLRRVLVEGNFSLIHAHSSFSGLLARIARPRRSPPIVFQPHAWSWLAVAPELQAPLKRLERALASRTDLLVCVSAEELSVGRAAGVEPRRAIVIPNGVPFPPHPRERPDKPDVPRGGAIGRLSAQKGIDVLIRAAARPEWPTGLSIDVLGTGADEAELRALVAELGVADRVRLRGYVDDPQPHLERWDLFVLPSRYEGAPLALLEALAAGLVLVSTRVAGVAELLPGSQLTVPIDDPSALARALATALDDWPAAVAEAAAFRARAATEYSLETQLERTLTAYRELVGAGSSTSSARRWRRPPA